MGEVTTLGLDIAKSDSHNLRRNPVRWKALVLGQQLS